MSKLSVRNMQGEAVGELDLADECLVRDKGAQSVHDAVVAHRAACRAGSASTRTKGEVRGTGAKPWKQKGTGRARAGYRRSPVWRGGGAAFGPKPRDFAKGLNRKMARLAFRRAFSERVFAGEVTVVDPFALDEGKTRRLAEFLRRHGAAGGALLIVDRVDENLRRASRNLAGFEVAPAVSVDTYRLLRYPRVFVTKDGLAGIEKRLRPAAGRAS